MANTRIIRERVRKSDEAPATWEEIGRQKRKKNIQNVLKGKYIYVYATSF